MECNRQPRNRETNRMRVAIGAVALLCGMALPANRRSREPRAAQAADPCGWIGVAVRPISICLCCQPRHGEPYGAIFEQPDTGSPAALKPASRRVT